MKAIHFYIILFFVGLAFSCKKKTYPDSTYENEVVYYFKGTVGNTPVSFEGGNQDYYMYSSVQQDANGIYNFIGDLKKSNCVNCPNSIKIQINDFKISATGAPVKIDSSLQVKVYPISTGTLTHYSVVFNSSYNKTAASYKWDFGDGATLVSLDATPPTHIYAKSGVYNVCLTVTGTDGCVSTICNEQRIGVPGSSTYITASSAGNKTINFTQHTSGTSTVTSLWDFGDDNSSSQVNPTHTYLYPGSRPVTLRVTDANNVVTLSTYNVIVGNDLSSCAANYQIASTTNVVDPQSALAFSKIIIKWTDANGKIYYSDNELQPASSYFQIVSVDNYDANELGQKTKKLHVKFRCTVYNGSDSVLIDNADAVISVAYN